MPDHIATRRLRAIRFGSFAAALLVSSAAIAQPSYRIRSDAAAPLNADHGWSAASNQLVAVNADAPFRLRMEAELPEGASPALQARRNGGTWETLDAQAFPYPTRELEYAFEGDTVGSAPRGWTLTRGNLQVVAGGAERILKGTGGPEGLLATTKTPWPIPEFKFGATILPGSSSGAGLVFGHRDARNYGLVHFDPKGAIRVSRITDGRSRSLHEEAAAFTLGAPATAEVQYEAGQLEISFDDDPVKFLVPMADTPSGGVGVWLPAGAEAGLSELFLEGVPATPRVSIVESTAYEAGAATQDLLTGSRLPFAPGIGLSLANETPAWTGAGRHSEFEWPLVIRRHADGPVVNEAGDRFDFRLADQAGAPISGAPVASVILAIPSDHLGGTFIEAPGRIGPWQAANGDLYFVMEPTETDNRFMMMKSADGGRSWAEVDGANRPKTGDLESVDGRQVGDTIHVAHQVTKAVRTHAFRTSDHPTHPDSWAVTDAPAATGDALSQMASLVVRSDGSMVLVFLADRLHYAVRTASGAWSPARPLDTSPSEGDTGPQAVLGKDDTVHLAYVGRDGTINYRRLLPDGTLTPRQTIAQGAGTSEDDFGAVLPLAYDAASDTLIVVYRLADGHLWERRIVGGEAPTEAARVSDRRVVASPVDSQQPTADIVLDGTTPYVLFVAEDTRSLYATRDTGDGWQTPVRWIGGIEGSWVRGNIIRRADGRRVYGFVYDAGSQGGAGLNRYGEVPLEPR